MLKKNKELKSLEELLYKYQIDNYNLKNAISDLKSTIAFLDDNIYVSSKNKDCVNKEGTTLNQYIEYLEELKKDGFGEYGIINLPTVSILPNEHELVFRSDGK